MSAAFPEETPAQAELGRGTPQGLRGLGLDGPLAQPRSRLKNESPIKTLYRRTGHCCSTVVLSKRSTCADGKKYVRVTVEQTGNNTKDAGKETHDKKNDKSKNTDDGDKDSPNPPN